MVHFGWRRAIALALVAAGCHGHHAPPSSDEPITNGIRQVYSIDLGGVASADKAAALDRAVRTVRLRVEGAGVAHRVALANEQIVVDLGTDNPEIAAHVADLLGPTGRFEVHIAESGSPYMKQLAAKVASDAAAIAAEITSDTEEWTASGHHVDWFLRADDRRQEMTPDEARQHHCFGRTDGNTVRCEVPGRRVLETYVDDLARRDRAFAIPPGRMLAFERVPAVATRRPGWRSYLIERTDLVSGASIQRATPVSDDRHVRVDVVLDDRASRSLAAALEPHAGDKLVLVLDGAVLSAPIVQAVPHDGHLSILADDAVEARDLAIVLASGALPGPMREEVQTRLTPSGR